MLTIGLGFHLRTSTFAIIDKNGQLINTRTVRGDWTQAVAAIKQFVRRRVWLREVQWPSSFAA